VAPKRALLLDALGTLVELEPPWTRLHEALGDELPLRRVEAATRAEMSYYREHSHEGRDAASLADLRARCAAVLSRELGREVGVDTLMAAIRFHPFPDAAPALDAARERGLTTVCVSNWDSALPEVLERCGLAARLAAVVASATVGARKPDPAIFVAALEAAGCTPAEALHVGDTPEEDVAGARAAGIDVLLLDREGKEEPPGEVPRIASLSEINQYLGP
jgi:putative hydrolase of the HAD superfamily